MLFYGAFTSVVNLVTHETFKALFIESNSIIFNPPSFQSPINLFILTLCGLLSHIKLSTLLLKFSGNVKTEVLYVSLDNPSVLAILFFTKQIQFPSFPGVKDFFQVFWVVIKIKTFTFTSIVGEVNT